MRRCLAFTVVAFGLFAVPGMARQPAAAPKADAARIARLIEALGSAEFAERERAGRELLALEDAAVEPLRKALAMKRGLEFTRRAEALLEALAIHEPGGEVVKGLKLRLSADRTTVKPGETVTLTTTLCNMTDRPLNVKVGYTTCGNYLECGAALRQDRPVPGKPAAELRPKCKVGFCGTGAGPIYVTVPAKRALRFQTQATRPPRQAVYTLGKAGFFEFERTGGPDVLRVMLLVARGDNLPRPARPGMKGTGIRPADETAPFWHGTIRSNDVRLQSVP
jgi:hypothetical protein